MAVGRGPVVTVVRPEHRDVRLDLRGKMKNDGFVGAEVCRNNGVPAGLCDGPVGDFVRRLVAQRGGGRMLP